MKILPIKCLKPNLPMLNGRQLVKPGERIKYDRKTNHAKMYNYQWSKVRKQFIKEHPLCKACLEEGKVTAAEQVDHIIPHKGSEKLFWDSGNWQSLCASCHSTKTITENGGFGGSAET